MTISLEKLFNIKDIKKKARNFGLVLAATAMIGGCNWFNLPTPSTTTTTTLPPVTTTTTTTLPPTTTTTLYVPPTTTTTLYVPPTTTTTLPPVTTTTLPPTTTTTLYVPPTTTTTLPQGNYFDGTFEFNPSYIVGDKFNYSWTIKNKDFPTKKMIIDNTNKDSLEYKVLRDDEEVFGFNLEQTLKLKFGYGGYFTVKNTNTKSIFSISENCWVTYLFFRDNEGPSSFAYTMDNLTLDRLGNYWVELNIKYNLDGEDQKYKQKFTSPIISVR